MLKDISLLLTSLRIDKTKTKDDRIVLNGCIDLHTIEPPDWLVLADCEIEYEAGSKKIEDILVDSLFPFSLKFTRDISVMFIPAIREPNNRAIVGIAHVLRKELADNELLLAKIHQLIEEHGKEGN